MKYLKILNLLLLSLFILSCDDEFEDDIVKDSVPEIPVTFEGATTYGFNPYYTVSRAAGGTISITIQIPENSSHKIKSIDKIVVGATGINPGSLDADVGKLYKDPIPVDGYSYTINTSVAEFDLQAPASARIGTGPPPTGTTFIERAFMFRLVMENDSVIIPVQLRIRVN